MAAGLRAGQPAAPTPGAPSHHPQAIRRRQAPFAANAARCDNFRRAGLGHGLRYALGELLVCPYCLAQWVTGAFAIGLVAAPRGTRFVASIYAAQTLSDVLQLAYNAAEDRA